MKATDTNEIDATGSAPISRKRWFAALFVVGAVSVACVALSFGWQLLQNPVKDIDVTQLQSVRIFNPSTKIEVEVEPQRWSKLVNNFRSSFVSWNSFKWEGLAVVKFEFKDGHTETVSVFDTGRSPGCFRIGRISYTGGDERVLIQIMDDEFKRLKKLQRGM